MTEHKYEYHLIDDHIDDVTEELISEREQDIDSITREIYDINEIFNRLNTIVHEQEHLLDNIEDNIQDVVINVENAEIELESAKKKQVVVFGGYFGYY